MTDNDKQILTRWRNAVFNEHLLSELDKGTPGYLLGPRTPEDIAVLKEYSDASEVLKQIEDPAVKEVVERYQKPAPDVYGSDPLWHAHVANWHAARKELLDIASELDPVTLN